MINGSYFICNIFSKLNNKMKNKTTTRILPFVCINILSINIIERFHGNFHIFVQSKKKRKIIYILIVGIFTPILIYDLTT